MDRSPEDLMRNLDKALHARTPPSMREPLGDVEKSCDKHGAYQSSGVRYMGKREIWTTCPSCEEARLARDRQEEAERQADRARAQLESMLQEAAIPPRFMDRTLDNFKASTEGQRAALGIVRDFVENFEANAKRGNSLILSGMPGTGKSHLATAALQAIMPQHCGLYTTCMSVIRNVRGTWRKDSESSEAEVLRAYTSVELLVLDEIGVQYGTDGEQTILFDVLDRRYRDMKPSILLTNQNKQGFKEFIGERSFDRLVETSRWVAFDWPSYRPQARKEAA